jgi:hypothetical protein
LRLERFELYMKRRRNDIVSAELMVSSLPDVLAKLILDFSDLGSSTEIGFDFASLSKFKLDCLSISKKDVYNPRIPSFLNVIAHVSHLVLKNVQFPRNSELYSGVPHLFTKLKQLDYLGPVILSSVSPNLQEFYLYEDNEGRGRSKTSIKEDLQYMLEEYPDFLKLNLEEKE